MTSEPANDERPSASDGADRASETEQSTPAPAAAAAPGARGKRKKDEKPPVWPEPGAPVPGAGTPEGDALVEAWRAFEVGDYRRVRELCRGLREARRDEVARAARDLDARTRVDLVQVAALCACLAFFLWIAYVYVIR